MKTSILILSCLSLTLLTASGQRRVKQAGPADFEATVKAAADAFKEGRHAACITQLNSAIEIARGELVKGVRACFIEPPAGFRVQDEDRTQDNAAAQMFGVGGLAGSQVQRTYRSDDKEVTITGQIDSALIKTMSMMFDNPAFRPAGAEPVEYEGAKGLLHKDENALKVILDGKHYFEVKGDVGEDELIKFFPQATVDKLRRLLRS